mmetsp:Transcript_23588/g.42542  ORF Transcript_23588/g.42542 Transcript_23588/m.42542 type:complete len:232 (+) Transcript_23588:337-1032(+)
MEPMDPACARRAPACAKSCCCARYVAAAVWLPPAAAAACATCCCCCMDRGTLSMYGSWCGISPDATKLKKSSTLEFRCTNPSCIRRAVKPVDESTRNKFANDMALAPDPNRLFALFPELPKFPCCCMLRRRVLKLALEPPPLDSLLFRFPTLPLERDRIRFSILPALAMRRALAILEKLLAGASDPVPPCAVDVDVEPSQFFMPLLGAEFCPGTAPPDWIKLAKLSIDCKL